MGNTQDKTPSGGGGETLPGKEKHPWKEKTGR
jgi:hypothetical protein